MRHLISKWFAYQEFIIFEHKKYISQESKAIFKKVTKDNVFDICDLEPREYAKRYISFLEAGDDGYYGYMEGKCVHRAWLQKGPRKVEIHAALSYSIQEGEVYLHYARTHQDYRGKNIYPHLLSTLTRSYQEVEKKLVACVHAPNPSAVNSLQKAGFVERERIRMLLIFGFKFIR